MVFDVIAKRQDRAAIVAGFLDGHCQFDQAGDLVRSDIVEQCILAAMVAKKRGVVDSSLGADVAHRQLLECRMFEQPKQGLSQGNAGAHGTRVLRA
jgi:hypothetical protein